MLWNPKISAIQRMNNALIIPELLLTTFIPSINAKTQSRSQARSSLLGQGMEERAWNRPWHTTIALKGQRVTVNRRKRNNYGKQKTFFHQ